MGMRISPSPPADRGTRVHAACVSSVSVDAAITWQLSFSKSAARSLKAVISVGQT
jgi:hypothetical protein